MALRYQKERERAPRVVAKGRERMAERIIEAAREHDVPLVENRELTHLLDALDLDTEIPPELYRAVAEVLAFVYHLNRGFEDPIKDTGE